MDEHPWNIQTRSCHIFYLYTFFRACSLGAIFISLSVVDHLSHLFTSSTVVNSIRTNDWVSFIVSLLDPTLDQRRFVPCSYSHIRIVYKSPMMPFLSSPPPILLIFSFLSRPHMVTRLEVEIRA